MGSQNIATFFFLLLLAPREVNKVAKAPQMLLVVLIGLF